MQTISEVISIIVENHGKHSLLDSNFVLAVFADLAPNLHKEKELLRSFLLSGGAEKILDTINSPAEDQKTRLEQIVKTVEDKQWVSKPAAQYICCEVYKGIAKRDLVFSLEGEENINKEVPLSQANKTKKTSMPLIIFVSVILMVVVICLIVFAKKDPTQMETSKTEVPVTEVLLTTHIHKWGDAECGIPQTCMICEEIGSIVKEHVWKSASFANPKTCEVCGTVDGTPISHSSISVEEEVQLIREYYNAIESNISAEKYKNIELRQGVEGYYNNSGALACVYVCRGTEGIGDYSNTYSRFYYFKDGEVFFVFFEGTDSHRLYFVDEMLMRWRYTSIEGESINYDFGGSSEFDFWEQLALKEADTFT